jgi:ATP adenylyltransferase
MSKNYVNIKHANRPSDREGKYAKVINKIKNDRLCPFCEENFLKYHKLPVIKENKNWFLTKNMYPYEETRLHLLLVHKKHISSIEEITPEGWLDLQKIINSSIKEFKIKGGAFFIRFGDSKLTGATVTHLHAHLIAPKRVRKNPILVRLG